MDIQLIDFVYDLLREDWSMDEETPGVGYYTTLNGLKEGAGIDKIDSVSWIGTEGQAIAYCYNRNTVEVTAIADVATFHQVWDYFSRLMAGSNKPCEVFNLVSSQLDTIPANWTPAKEAFEDEYAGRSFQLEGTDWGIAVAGIAGTWCACRFKDGRWVKSSISTLPGQKKFFYGKGFKDICSKIEQHVKASSTQLAASPEKV